MDVEEESITYGRSKKNDEEDGRKWLVIYWTLYLLSETKYEETQRYARKISEEKEGKILITSFIPIDVLVKIFPLNSVIRKNENILDFINDEIIYSEQQDLIKTSFDHRSVDRKRRYNVDDALNFVALKLGLNFILIPFPTVNLNFSDINSILPHPDHIKSIVKTESEALNAFYKVEFTSFHNFIKYLTNTNKPCLLNGTKTPLNTRPSIFHSLNNRITKSLNIKTQGSHSILNTIPNFKQFSRNRWIKFSIPASISNIALAPFKLIEHLSSYVKTTLILFPPLSPFGYALLLKSVSFDTCEVIMRDGGIHIHDARFEFFPVSEFEEIVLWSVMKSSHSNSYLFKFPAQRNPISSACPNNTPLNTRKKSFSKQKLSKVLSIRKKQRRLIKRNKRISSSQSHSHSLRTRNRHTSTALGKVANLLKKVKI